MANYFTIVLVIRLGSEGVTADLAAKVFNMVFLFGSSGIRASQRASTVVANEVRSPEVVSVAKGMFGFWDRPHQDKALTQPFCRNPSK